MLPRRIARLLPLVLFRSCVLPLDKTVTTHEKTLLTHGRRDRTAVMREPLEKNIAQERLWLRVHREIRQRGQGTPAGGHAGKRAGLAPGAREGEFAALRGVPPDKLARGKTRWLTAFRDKGFVAAL